MAPNGDVCIASGPPFHRWNTTGITMLTQKRISVFGLEYIKVPLPKIFLDLPLIVDHGRSEKVHLKPTKIVNV